MVQYCQIVLPTIQIILGGGGNVSLRARISFCSVILHKHPEKSPEIITYDVDVELACICCCNMWTH